MKSLRRKRVGGRVAFHFGGTLTATAAMNSGLGSSETWSGYALQCVSRVPGLGGRFESFTSLRAHRLGPSRNTDHGADSIGQDESERNAGVVGKPNSER